jgi:hypothetical protein
MARTRGTYVSWTSTMASVFLYTNWETRLRPTKDKMEAAISIVSERDFKAQSLE